MSPESMKVTLSSSAALPTDLAHPSDSQFPPNNKPIHYQRSPDYQDTTNQKPHYDSEHSQTISLQTGFRYNNPNANSNDNVANKSANQNDATNNRDSAQRQKIHDFIVSEPRPQSFQSPPPRTTLTTNDIKLVNNAFVNSNPESSSIIIVSTPSSIINTTSSKAPKTTSHPRDGIDAPTMLSPNDDSIRFVLSNSKSSQNRTRDTSESMTLYMRQEALAQTTTTTTVRPRDRIVVPTTYAPLKNWKLQYVKRPPAAVTTLPLNTIANSHSDDKKHASQFDEITFTTPVGPVTSKYPTNDYNRPLSPGAGTRQQSFREILNKTYETSTPTKFHVSPYTSLKSLLSEESTKLSFRPTAGPPNNTMPPSSSKPFRSYYIITAPPKKNTPDPTTRPPTNYFSNNEHTTTTPISITSSASTPAASSNYDWTPISYSYNAKAPSGDSSRLAPFKPTENSIYVDDVDMTTSFPIRNHFPSTYYPRPTGYTPMAYTPTTTPPSITTARIMLAPSGSTSERDHYRKVVRMRSKKKVNPSTGQTINEEPEIINGNHYGKFTGSVANDNEDKNVYRQPHRFPLIDVSPNAESSTKHDDLLSNLPTKFYSNYRHVKEEKTLADYIRDNESEPQVIDESGHRGVLGGHGQSGKHEKFRATVEMPELNIPTESEIKAKLKQLEDTAEKDIETEEHYETTTTLSRQHIIDDSGSDSAKDRPNDNYDNRRMTITAIEQGLAPQTTTRMNSNLTQTTTTQRTINSIHTSPPRASRVNAAIKTTIAAASLPPTRRSNTATTAPIRFATLPLLKCTDSTPNAKCNEIPSRYTNQAKSKSHPIAPYIYKLFTIFIKTTWSNGARLPTYAEN